MKKLAFLVTGAAALALAACNNTDADDGADDAADTTVVETETVEPAPVVNETTVVEDGDGEEDDVDVEADLDDGDVSVEADIE